MSLVMNTTYHWQLPSGGELYSGDLIELYIDGSWLPGRIDFRPKKQYILIMDDGQELPITEDLVLRCLDEKFFS